MYVCMHTLKRKTSASPDNVRMCTLPYKHIRIVIAHSHLQMSYMPTHTHTCMFGTTQAIDKKAQIRQLAIIGKLYKWVLCYCLISTHTIA